MLKVVELYVYPVKSCAAVAVTEMKMDEKGPADDRRWMIVDENGRFISQRELPELARFCPFLEGGRWHLRSPDGLNFLLPTDGQPIKVSIWKDHVEALDCGEQAASWLSEQLKRPARLVYAGHHFQRPISEKYESPFARLSFVDAMPLLLVSRESLQDLNDKLPTPIDMARFRPNVVIEGGHPFEEDLWQKLKIGTHRFKVAKDCSRCIVTTIDQGSGISSAPEPLRTLSGYRRGSGHKVFFGQYLIHEKTGSIALGMNVQPMERK